MKNLYILSIILLVLGTNIARSQTYIQGEAVISFSTVGVSKYLKPIERLTTLESSRIIERLDPDYFKLSDSEHPGEFWLRDGILVQIVSRKITPEMPGSDPEILYYTSTPQVIQQPGNKVDDSRKRDYYSEYKIVDGSSTFLQYYRSTSNRTRFVLHDKQKRYQIIGHIRCKPEDLTKANHFAKTLLESIIIK